MNYRAFIVSIPCLLLTVSCAQPSASEAQANLCTSLAEFKTSLATLGSVSPSSTVEDLKQAQADVKQAWNGIQSDFQDLEVARVEDFSQAYNNLDKAINAVPDQATLSEGAGAIQEEVTAVAAARDQLYSGLQCP
jgi:endonuclease/exonuclease/phosphatase (EEP) superfamily protein YafD